MKIKLNHLPIFLDFTKAINFNFNFTTAAGGACEAAANISSLP
jgi:hypothetical protein